MSIQKGRTRSQVAKAKSNGQGDGSHRPDRKVLAYASAETGIARSDFMAVAIDEIYRSAARGTGVSPSMQAHTMLNAVGKMLALENLKLRAGKSRNGVQPEFFLTE